MWTVKYIVINIIVIIAAFMWARVPLALLQESAVLQVDRTEDNLLVLAVPNLQGN